MKEKEEKEEIGQIEENNEKENIINIKEEIEKNDILNEQENIIIDKNNIDLKEENNSFIGDLIELQKNIKKDISLKKICN